jgi:hypothetical protein
MNNSDHISESLETIFMIKIIKFFDADPRFGMEKVRIRDKHAGYATLPFSKVIHHYTQCCGTGTGTVGTVTF